MNKYLITKYVYAKNVSSALINEKKSDIQQITLIEEPEELTKIGF